MSYKTRLGYLLMLALLGLTLTMASIPEYAAGEEELSEPVIEAPAFTYGDIPEPQLIDVDEDLSAFGEGRNLATATYPNLRIYPIYSRLDDASVEFQNYMKNDLVPPIISYFQGALKVKSPIASKLSFKSTVTTLCGLTTPKELFTGVAADIAYFFTVNPMEDSSTVASSYACFLASGTSRPIVATAYFNTVIFKATTDVLLHEKNTYMLMHEITHALGFASSMYKYFIDANGKRLSGHIKSGVLSGEEAIILDVEPLTSKIRTFFGCPTIEGAYMENGGSSGTAGSHFEKRQFIFEAMTSPLVYQQSFSEFTLALLEGTGWYVPDYSYADPYWFGQGNGCDFLTGSCPVTNGAYDEWCTGTARGCTVQGRGAGTCSSDIRSDGCRYQYPNVNYDCENPNAAKYGRYPSIQTFGRDGNSKCFTGTLSETSTSDSSTTFCFQYECVGSGLSTQLRVLFGGRTFTCKYKGIYRPSGYKGYFDCPDPLTFCKTVGAPVCPRGCMGRGTCVDGICQCKKGFSGKDCAAKV